ncbi:class I SAM-dependent methyltransferase [Metabacillus sediminilitoris]|uniref:Class I SAM-dependent methyltransferase n=1 Tax=Metabacillus sediminilitoris TaxID=2567941 RepID=A0A4S4BWU2_9BACI|nr:class I SAM-dependent methyltransferase [Metabacillus sediminilitoris]QGQ44727.1 methyltransferase [Metabacillus sediminilitoris]THF78925.1 class I SAM-dependent methyltransferase [Metabacillus sediminilitoris]
MWNQYYRINLTDQEIQRGSHRNQIGGKWNEIGELQFRFMKEQGLQPDHELLDIGCGSLRGGIFFIEYLNEGKYSGLDLNSSLIKAGQSEIKKAGLMSKKPTLLVNDSFHFNLFKKKFDYAIAQSVFTHLPVNVIQRCLIHLEQVLNPGGKFYATFFETESKFHVDPVNQPNSGGVVTKIDSDPYHYHISLFEYLIEGSSLQMEYIGDWGHPRNQKMISFSKI